MAFNYNQMELPYEEQYIEYPVESDPRAYVKMGGYEDIVWQTQQLLGGNPNPSGSVREYRGQWGSTHPYNLPPAYTPPAPPQYTLTSQSQQMSPLEQAMLDLNKIVDNFVEEKRGMNFQAKAETDTREGSLYRELDEFQDENDENLDIPQQSFLGLTNEPIQQEEQQEPVGAQGDQESYMLESPLDINLDELGMDPEKKWDNVQDSSEDHIEQQHCSPVEECQSEVILGEQGKMQFQEEMKEELRELQGSPATGAIVDTGELNSPMLDEECSGGGEIEVLQESTAHNTMAPLSTAPSKSQNYPLPACVQPSPAANPTAPSHCPAYTLPVHTVPIPAASPKSKNSAPEAHTSPLLPAPHFKRLVASVYNLATTSTTMAAAFIAWHSGWLGCRFGLGAPEPRHS